MINKKPPSIIVWSLKPENCKILMEHNVLWAFDQFQHIGSGHLEVTRSEDDPNFVITCGKQPREFLNYLITENATMTHLEIFDYPKNSLLGGIAKFLGLAPPISPESVFNDRNKIQLSEDDIDGIKALYHSFSPRSNIDYHFHVN